MWAGGNTWRGSACRSAAVVHVDFISQYPTVNALLGNWDVLTAKSVSFEDCTDEARKMLAGVNLEDTFDPEFWKHLSFFALVLPENDILPVRAVYNGRTKNIGLNFLTSKQPIWFAGPDVVAVPLLTGKAPHIIKAIRMVPHGRQSGLRNTNLAGMVTIKPSDDFFRHVIEQRIKHKPTNKPLGDFLKVLGTSGSYGLFVEVNLEKLAKPVHVQGVLRRNFTREAVFRRREARPLVFPACGIAHHRRRAAAIGHAGEGCNGCRWNLPFLRHGLSLHREQRARRASPVPGRAVQAGRWPRGGEGTFVERSR